MVEIIGCPVSTTLEIIGRKWTINIINDILFGKHRFSELKEQNKGISSKVLSSRLKMLDEHGIISKDVTNMNPVIIEYTLTPLGYELRYILLELALFSTLNKREKLLSDPDAPTAEIIEAIGERYAIDQEELDYYIRRSQDMTEEEISQKNYGY